MKRREDTPVSVDVVEAIANVDGTDPRRLPFVLHDHVDTEALEMLVSHGPDSTAICFEVVGHDVAVRGDGTIVVDGEKVSQRD